MNKCLKFIVKGRVQGVYYRKYTSIAMNKEGIIGYVKNLPNGDVEFAIKARENEDIAKIIEILKKGSPKSIVESIEMIECDEDINFSDSFEVRY